MSPRSLLEAIGSDASSLHFRARFDGSELFLRDHALQGACMLPGAVTLEMAREAFVRSQGLGADTPLEFQEVMWIRPLIVDREPVDVRFRLAHRGPRTGAFAINVGRATMPHVGPDAVADAATLVCRGRVRASYEKPGLLDVSKLESCCQAGSITGDHCYSIFSRMRVAYGPTHRTLRELAWGTRPEGGRVVLATLEQREPGGHCTLNPGMLDGALQASVALTDLCSDQADASGPVIPEVPFSIRAAKIWGRLPARAFAYLEESIGMRAFGRTVDIQLCDESGKVCAQIFGLATRRMGLASP